MFFIIKYKLKYIFYLCKINYSFFIIKKIKICNFYSKLGWTNTNLHDIFIIEIIKMQFCGDFIEKQ